MSLVTTLDIAVHERAFLVENGVPTRFLAAGRHRVWAPLQKIEVKRFPVDALVVELLPEYRALVPAGLLLEVDVARDERAIVSKRGRPVRVLETGVHFLWQHDGVEVETIACRGVACEPLPKELAALLGGKGYVETSVTDGAVALRFKDGQIDAVLPPGRHAAFTLDHDVKLVALDLRERILAVTGQEVMTKDRVTLRLNVSIAYRIVDVKRFVSSVKDGEAALYLAGQLVFRDLVAGHALDALLQDREILSSRAHEALVASAASLGVEIARVGVKDLILPGEMKTIMNRVIEAQKQAEANVIARREEAAATRSLAQTAKILEESPTLMRLKELEAYQELASKVGKVHLVMGEGGLGKLELKA